MKIDVLGLGHHLEVIRVIIPSVPVLVVDYLSGKKGAPDHFFRDGSVLVATI